MYLNNIIAASILVASASAKASEAIPYKLAAKSLNPFGNQAYGLTKRQSGYQPSQTFCSGYGTCAEACGTGYETCASNDGDLHCFDPTVKETCCPTGTGDSCSEGYYCTQATDLTVWCCPDGMDLTACAAIYSLTGVLQSVTPSSVASASASTIPTTSASVTTSDIVSPPAYTTPTTPPVASLSATKTGGGSNATFTGSTTATATLSVFTGMAGKMEKWVGGSVLVAAVGMGLLL
ncbi:hypothetical protein BCIN_02g02450 [Botrytis cinerea B05.10]|uniref:Prp 4 c domain-containing protein n=3 Tax=Botryotinia fuckeliana TaxID=40559 RepID=A0A384J8X1_BOTFB|nr:hypothetical protein BCIN_02g02450 [Botrytis cinerea B05.10]ATZ46901.1 hypothetical protein BCIN_02g02450 [Botrytis cinerea B05.10]EMR83940.1 putative prp 4 c domain-containing protein [Botrytis cinerea BcDW1]CCD48612.1 hypothetical protein BofuT4_P109960.1 [Botrytis cinerea T4]